MLEPITALLEWFKYKIYYEVTSYTHTYMHACTHTQHTYTRTHACTHARTLIHLYTKHTNTSTPDVMRVDSACSDSVMTLAVSSGVLRMVMTSLCAPSLVYSFPILSTSTPCSAQWYTNYIQTCYTLMHTYRLIWQPSIHKQHVYLLLTILKIAVDDLLNSLKYFTFRIFFYGWKRDMIFFFDCKVHFKEFMTL